MKHCADTFLLSRHEHSRENLFAEVAASGRAEFMVFLFKNIVVLSC